MRQSQQPAASRPSSPPPGSAHGPYLRVAAQQQSLLLQQADEVVTDRRLQGGKRDDANHDRARLPHIAACQELFQALWPSYLRESSHWPWGHHYACFPISQMGKLRLKVTRAGNEGPGGRPW